MRRSLSAILVLAAITTIALHFHVSEKSLELDDGDIQQLHRRAAGVAVVSVRDGGAGVSHGDKELNPTKSFQVVQQQQHDILKNLHEQRKEQSRSGVREMAWANDAPSLSDDGGSQAALNASEVDYQTSLKHAEKPHQFARKVQKIERSQVLPQVQKLNPGGQQNLPPASLRPNVDPSPNLTVEIKDSPKFIHVPATTAKLRQPPPSIAETNFRRTELNDIFIAVKTTGKYHTWRLDILLETWVALAKEQVRNWLCNVCNLNKRCVTCMFVSADLFFFFFKEHV